MSESNHDKKTDVDLLRDAQLEIISDIDEIRSRLWDTNYLQEIEMLQKQSYPEDLNNLTKE